MKKSILFLLLFLSCAPRPKEVCVQQIIIDAPREFDARLKERESIREFIKQQLGDGKLRGCFTEDIQKASHVLRLNLGDPLKVELRPLHTKEITYQAFVPLHGSILLNAVNQAFLQGWQTLYVQRQLTLQNDEGVITALQHADPNIVSFAILLLGERQSVLGVMPLIELLKREDTNESIMLQAIGSLVMIKDKRAVPVLIDLTKSQESQFIVQIVFALGAIGGKEAEAFLVTLASGHPDANVQKSAQEALAELKKRR